jgi:hypothetical protein
MISSVAALIHSSRAGGIVGESALTVMVSSGCSHRHIRKGTAARAATIAATAASPWSCVEFLSSHFQSLVMMMST